MRRGVVLIVFGALLLAGCGGGAPSAAPVQPMTDTPEAVHAGWVTAMQENNRDALLVLAAEQSFKAAFVDDNLKPLRSFLNAGKYGALLKVETRSLTDDGASKIGVSVWTFERRTDCYRTILVIQDGAWKVTSWGVMAQCAGTR